MTSQFRQTNTGMRQRFREGTRQAHFVLRGMLVALLVMTLLALAGCGGDSSGGSGGSGGSVSNTPSEGGSYKAPKFKGSTFHADEAVGNGQVAIDLSAASDGYVAIAGTSSKRLKFQVIKGAETYTYDISSDGDPSVFPLQCGDGEYSFKVMENVMDSKYAESYSTSTDVQLENEFAPFLRPSDYVDYNKKSACVNKATEIASGAGSAMDVVNGVYDYVCSSVTYDEDKARTVQSGYMPSPDETMSTGKGICFDYASLAAAMLRSQGIPTKVIFGYVAPDNLYHAWNMFYTEETGWVTVDYEVNADSWNRLDLTFAANGADADFIGDGSHYSDVYIY